MEIIEEKYLTAIVFLEGVEKKTVKYRNIKNTERHIVFFHNFLKKRFAVKSINYYGKESRQFIKQAYIS